MIAASISIMFSFNELVDVVYIYIRLYCDYVNHFFAFKPIRHF